MPQYTDREINMNTSDYYYLQSIIDNGIIMFMEYFMKDRYPQVNTGDASSMFPPMFMQSAAFVCLTEL